ncbi:MAG: hypothetical protein EOP76_02570 [Variovorax sp.]|nr:MAG: hypothetical protein EOP76_02570 [Variovorax sp.]
MLPHLSLRAGVPIVLGHVASMALVAAAVSLGVSIDRALLQSLAGALLGIATVVWLSDRHAGRIRSSAGHAGLALGSFVLATAHGAGLVLVPALVPLCTGNAADRDVDALGGAIVQALVALGVHSAAMLAVTGVLAMGIALCHAPLRRPAGSDAQLRRPAASAFRGRWAGTPPRWDAPAVHPSAPGGSRRSP